MIRISKLADYGTVIMAELARQKGVARNAREIAEVTHISLPTVSKLLKQLSKANLVVSQRGVYGGYVLTQPAEEIPLTAIINALEGRLALTECSHSAGVCQVEKSCAIRQRWKNLSGIIAEMLGKITLAYMTREER